MLRAGPDAPFEPLVLQPLPQPPYLNCACVPCSLAPAGGLVGTPLAQQLAKEGRALAPTTDVGDTVAVVAYCLA